MPWEWFGPPDGNFDCPFKWKSTLVIPPLVEGVMAVENCVSAQVFLPSVSFRPVGWFAKLSAVYVRFDGDHSQAI